MQGGIENIDVLLADLRNQSNTNLQIFVLDPNRDGIAQITNILSLYRNQFDAVHVISHGQSGALLIGNTWLDNTNLNRYSASIESWRSALTTDADLLLYACDVAESASGECFLRQLADLTLADVAASQDKTGASSLSGNWTLEFSTGRIESTGIAALDWSSTLATVKVTTTQDVINGNTSSIAQLIASDGGDAFHCEKRLKRRKIPLGPTRSFCRLGCTSLMADFRFMTIFPSSARTRV